VLDKTNATPTLRETSKKTRIQRRIDELAAIEGQDNYG
jgi:hypothetical protein